MPFKFTRRNQLKSDSNHPKKSFICFNETSLKRMKNAFYFILKAPFVLEIFKFLSSLFAYAKNGLSKVNFIIYDVTALSSNYPNTHIAQCLTK